MPHDIPLILTIVVGLGLAFIFGTIAHRFKAPPLVGYLIAGVLIGPYTPGFVADQELANQLAELGVILLMFGVGLHFSLKDLLSVKGIAVPGAVVQIVIATALGLALALSFGWSVPAGIVFGLALSVASTVVLLKALQERRLVETERGRIAIGWLIVEDLAMVLALVIIPAVGGALGTGEHVVADPLADRLGLGVWGVLLITALKVAGFVAFMLLVGRRVIPWILHYVAHTGSRELFRLAVLAIALGVALGAAQLFGVSLALGAFFAGMILSESALSHRAAEESLPLRDAFAVLFFVSVGMLFDPRTLVTDPLPVLAVVLIIVVGKSLAAFLIVIAFRHPIGTALTISASLAQIGEFSFILAELGVGLHLLPEQGRDLILAGAILSILLNPLVFAAIDWLKPRLDRTGTASSEEAANEPVRATVSDAVDVTRAEGPSLPTKGHTVLVGYGRVGSVVGNALRQANVPLLVIEDADRIAADLHSEGVPFLHGNAAAPTIIKAAHLEGAERLVVAIPNAFEAGHIIRAGRTANPALPIVARAHSDEEAAHLRSHGASVVIMAEQEVARGFLREVLPAAAVAPI